MARGPVLVIVTGPPASGKTSVAENLAAELRLPLLTKDLIKESLFDSLGWGDQDRSKALGRASILLLHALVDALLAAGTSLVVEANFEAPSTPRFAALDARIVQAYCTAPERELVRRFERRDRHPGHDDDTYDLAGALAEGRWRPLELDAPLVELDTSREVDLTRVLELAR